MRAALATMLLQRERDTRRILLEEGVGVADALKAIRGPLFGLFLVAVDTGDSSAAAALSGRMHENLALVLSSPARPTSKARSSPASSRISRCCRKIC